MPSLRSRTNATLSVRSFCALLGLGSPLLLAPGEDAQGAPPPTENTDERAERDADRCHEHIRITMGRADAPVLLRLYFDPLKADSLAAWTEVRALLAQRSEQLRLEIIPVPPDSKERDKEQVFIWFLAMAQIERFESALFLLERSDHHRLYRRLRDPKQRAELAKELELELDDMEAALRPLSASSCLRSRLALEALPFFRPERQGVPHRSPMLEFRHRTRRSFFELSPPSRHDRLRPAVEAFVLQSRRPLPSAAPLPLPPKNEAPSTERTLPFALLYPRQGVLLGGTDLPHRLTIFMSDEDGGRASSTLRPAMDFRRRFPGVLSIHVVAVGDGDSGQRLARRLCATRRLGRELEYLKFLALAPALRGPIFRALTRDLDRENQNAPCVDARPFQEPSGKQGSGKANENPSQGAWFDGRAINHVGLERLLPTLRRHRSLPLLDWFWPTSVS